MSWRAGAELFSNLWPLVRAHIRNPRQRREFTAALLQVFLDNDLDPELVADLDPEVRAALETLGVEVAPEGDDGDPDRIVEQCIRQLSDADPAARATAAEALRDFGPETRNPPRTARAALAALAGALNDPVARVRREAALSIRVFARSGHCHRQTHVEEMTKKPTARIS